MTGDPIKFTMQDSDTGKHPTRILDILLYSLVALSIVFFWLVPLRSSFWIDEIATAFVARNGFSHWSLAIGPQVTESIYYWFPKLVDRLLGVSEPAYRAPSVLALGFALLLIAHLTSRLIHPQAAWLAVFACLALRGFNYQASDARAYAMGTCVAAASLLFLVRWLDDNRWQDAGLFLLSAELLWRVHLVYWPLYILFAIYVATRLVLQDTQVVWLKVAVVFFVLALGLIPVLIDALNLLREASAHAMAIKPLLSDLVGSLKLGMVIACGGAAWFLKLLYDRNAVSKPASSSALTLIFGWWLIHPLCLFAFSRITGNSVFMPRYLSIALPGVALSVTAMAASWIKPEHFKRTSILLAAIVLLNPSQWRAPWPKHDISDWRAAAQSVREFVGNDSIPVLCPSPYLEARDSAWTTDYKLPGFFYAHLDVYPIRGTPYLLPFEPSSRSEQFVANLVNGPLVASGRFVLYGWSGNAKYWEVWLRNRPELAGWTYKNRGPFGNVDVIVFENTSTKKVQGSSEKAY